MNDKDKESSVDKLNSLMNDALKIVSDFLARYKGLPVLLAIGLAALGLVVNLLPAWPLVAWLAQTDILLHLSVILGLLGILMGDAL